MSFCDATEAHAIKGAVHGATGVLLAMMAVYNVCAWYQRRERPLLFNAMAYTAVTIFEVYQVLKHCRKSP